MRLFLIVILALAFASPAAAHYGDRWFQSAAGVTDGIEGKYRLDVFKKCFPAAASHRWTKGFTTLFDHFKCLVDSQKTRNTCWVTAHIVGKNWRGIVLTSDSGTDRYGGCGPADIALRQSYR